MSSTTTPTYLAHFESDVVLRNGRTLRLRPVRAEDREAMLAFFQALSSDSLHSRFFDARTPETAMRDTPVDIDYENDFGVVGERKAARSSPSRTTSGRAVIRRSPRSRSPSRTARRDAASARGCSKSWPTSRGRNTSRPSTPTRCRTTARCSTSSSAPAST